MVLKPFHNKICIQAKGTTPVPTLFEIRIKFDQRLADFTTKGHAGKVELDSETIERKLRR